MRCCRRSGRRCSGNRRAGSRRGHRRSRSCGGCGRRWSRGCDRGRRNRGRGYRRAGRSGGRRRRGCIRRLARVSTQSSSHLVIRGGRIPTQRHETTQGDGGDESSHKGVFDQRRALFGPKFHHVFVVPVCVSRETPRGWPAFYRPRGSRTWRPIRHQTERSSPLSGPRRDSLSGYGLHDRLPRAFEHPVGRASLQGMR